MEAKGFFSKSSNILPLAILLAGVSMFGAGVYTVEKQTKDIQSRDALHMQQVEKLKSHISFEDSLIIKQNLAITNQNSMIHSLEMQNNDLKKQIKTYQDKSESPSPVVNTPTPANKNDVQVVSNSEQHRKVNVIATAYTSTCDGCSGKTATGIDVRNTTQYGGANVIATDPSIIPLHSLVRIDTESGQSLVAVVEDTGGAIKGGKIDVLVSSTSKAMEFGRQHATITVLREGA